MTEFYPQIRAVHIGAVLFSGALFFSRGLGVLLGARWPQAAPVRWASYGIDTVLLTAALMLLNVVSATVFANHWLGVKLGLLVVYVVLGSFALKRARSARARAICFAAAVLVFAAMFGIARTHQPWGWLAVASLPLRDEGATLNAAPRSRALGSRTAARPGRWSSRCARRCGRRHRAAPARRCG